MNQLTTISIESVGAIASLAGSTVSKVQAAAQQLGIVPALNISGVAHYLDADAEAIVRAIQRQQITQQSIGDRSDAR